MVLGLGINLGENLNMIFPSRQKLGLKSTLHCGIALILASAVEVLNQFFQSHFGLRFSHLGDFCLVQSHQSHDINKRSILEVPSFQEDSLLNVKLQSTERKLTFEPDQSYLWFSQKNE